MFKTPNEFSIHIEKMVLEDKNLNHVDAIIKYCEQNQIEVEDVKSLVNKSLKAKLKKDYIEMNYLKSSTVLVG